MLSVSTTDQDRVGNELKKKKTDLYKGTAKAISLHQVSQLKLMKLIKIDTRLTILSLSVLLSEKLMSLLPEYVVPYMIHLLAHDPDFTKPQDFEQLIAIKE